VFHYFLRLAAPIIAVSAVAALAANIGQDMAQFGFHFTTKPLAFKLNKIVPNFAAFLQKTIFSGYGAFNFFKSVVKIALIGTVAFVLIYSDIQKIANLQTATLALGIKTIGGLAMRMLILCAFFLLILAIPDYMVQRWQHRESLKMSKEEVKWEWKETEGDPQVRTRIRQRMRELLTQNIRQNVPKAEVVITNPTHLALALEYNETLVGPRVLAKGADELALRIKQIALDNGVPVEENKPLARALYPILEVGDIVPQEYWAVIAEILRRVRGADYYERRRRESAA
jgi:flagellar biosynthetic protein FlhB